MKKDEIMANGKWEFNEDVTDCFDDMLARSIPDYNTMRDLTLRITEPFLQSNSDFNLLDIGCSNGINLELFINKYMGKGYYVGVDNSLVMINKAKERLSNYNAKIDLINKDIVELPLPRFNYNIVTSVLTLQFVPIEYRPLILNRIYSTLKINGVFILIEKILQPNLAFNQIFVDSYYNIKRCNGYTNEQIEAKKKSLEGVLVSNTHIGNLELLKGAGFKYIDTFWKCLNFEGYIAIKGEM